MFLSGLVRFTPLLLLNVLEVKRVTSSLASIVNKYIHFLMPIASYSSKIGDFV